MKAKEQTTETKSLFKSLASFQQEVPVIHKGTTGYGYSYADLPTILNIINPLLAKHEIGFTQPIMGDCVKTILFHVETGETLESLINIPKEVTLKGMNDYQVLGSAITYIRRYALSSILGLVTDKDTDAAKPELTIEHENFLKVVEYIRNGGTMDEVRKKYRVSNEIENHIKKLI